MILPALFFYLFAAVCVASAVMVIVSRNPVHSVLFLILAFVNAAGLFILMGAEFLGMVLIFVYVGAVATLFLFVIMMLDVDFTELRSGFLEYLPIGLVIGGIFLFELLLTVGFWVINPGVAKSITAAIPTNASNTEALGLVLYTKYIHYFQVAGMVLLVAMIGAIVLTLRHKAGVKRQDVNVQNARTPELAMSVRKVASGQGLQDADAAEWVQ
jgi:NADH-quinone oxidoreductase subunit J